MRRVWELGLTSKNKHMIGKTMFTPEGSIRKREPWASLAWRSVSLSAHRHHPEIESAPGLHTSCFIPESHSPACCWSDSTWRATDLRHSYRHLCKTELWLCVQVATFLRHWPKASLSVSDGSCWDVCECWGFKLWRVTQTKWPVVHY